MLDDKEREPLVMDDQGSELVSSAQESSRSRSSGCKDEGDGAIEWTGVNYAVTDALGCTKTILRDCYGSVRGGEVCAVLGPSGAGKSSLLTFYPAA
jgi:ABC-type multidrug transport system ATPase subunit